MISHIGVLKLLTNNLTLSPLILHFTYYPLFPTSRLHSYLIQTQSLQSTPLNLPSKHVFYKGLTSPRLETLYTIHILYLSRHSFCLMTTKLTATISSVIVYVCLIDGPRYVL
ncbi:hypothetical protein EON63_00400 [archaeon]|nr:MAG: hypothetical protein EON63_00400 [archaeon]